MGRIHAIDNIVFSDQSLLPIWEKVKNRTRLSCEDGLLLYNSSDFAGIGQMAEYAKRQVSGDSVFFVINRQINPTNLCVNSCKFCDFSKKRGDQGTYELTLEQILESIDNDIREIHIVGGHHPDWPFEHYEDMLRKIHSRFPIAHIKAFTASEIDYFNLRWGIAPEESLARLKEVGLRSMPGGGAEILSSRIHELLFPDKASPDRWIEIHHLAHTMGIFTNCTMLYGHIETIEERVQHFMRLRELQDQTNGFLCFVPLKYQIGKTKLVAKSMSPIDDLKTVSISRLMLDNIPHIKAYWVMSGEDTAAIALNFGADDIDGTIGRERVAHAADAPSPVGLALEKVLRLIGDSGKIPVERDALYNAVNR